ncbi:MAG: anaerobic ribonucleoside-triphosphate reductase activating protein [Clostridiales bacterium]|nr:anaerobic ribonucleoside-triphosphate reductase activating protein [Clostridiales bacterium]
MYYGAMDFADCANGDGIRVTIFVSGCTNRCEGCFQPETWSFTYGREYTSETENRLMEALNKPYVSGLTLLGGEPFEPENQRVILGLLRRMRAELPDKNVWAFTGFLLEDLLREGFEKRCEATDEILSCIDVLVDGRFELSKRNISLKFRGSENQRVIDLKRSLSEKKIILLYE